jgi:hypothetical protein
VTPKSPMAIVTNQPVLGCDSMRRPKFPTPGRPHGQPGRAYQGPSTMTLEGGRNKKRECKVFGRAELQRKGRQRIRQKGEPHDAARSGHKRADGGDGERGAGPPLFGHLIPIDAGDDRGRLAGDVQENGGRGAAVHGPVVNPGQHDDGCQRGPDGVGERQEEGDGRRRPQAGQDPHHRSQYGADQGKEQVDRRRRQCETLQQELERLHG